MYNPLIRFRAFNLLLLGSGYCHQSFCAAVEGTNVETDSELRTRYALAKFQDSVNTYEAIYAAVLKIDGGANHHL